MKSVFAGCARELKLITRDSITLYLTLSPAVFAVVFLFVFAGAGEAATLLAVERNFPQALTAKLEAVAEVEYAENLERLKGRVAGTDSVAGVYLQDGEVRVLVEGNEGPGFADARRKLVSAALGAEGTDDTFEAVEGPTSLVYRVSMACILLLALFIGGAALGLGGVNERESGVIRALSVSPMGLWGYVTAKIIPALLLGMAGVSACALILGRWDALPRFILLALCGVFVSGILIFLIIAFAGNQIAAVGVLKMIMPVFLIVGISAAFIPEQWRFLYYALPMYWQYAAIDAILAGGRPAFPLLLVLATSVPWFAAVMVLFTKKVQIKAGRSSRG
jgi:ABC-2 type transport system permease protein